MQREIVEMDDLLQEARRHLSIAGSLALEERFCDVRRRESAFVGALSIPKEDGGTGRDPSFEKVELFSSDILPVPSVPPTTQGRGLAVWLAHLQSLLFGESPVRNF